MSTVVDISALERVYTFYCMFQFKLNGTVITKIVTVCHSKYFNLEGRVSLCIIYNIFRHIKLDIALAIAALNE